MAVYDINRTYLTEFKSIIGKFNKKKDIDKSKNKDDVKDDNSMGKYELHRVSASDNATFERLYHNEALTAEGVTLVDNDEEDMNILAKFNSWFRSNNDCSKSKTVKFYIILGKDMNNHYHLTGYNKYKDNIHILCIDWVDAGVKDPFKGNWRWFSDVVDNNAKREIAKGNHFYDHYISIYYGPIGIKDKVSKTNK